MLKILRSTDGRLVVFSLSGRIEAEHRAELQALLDAEKDSVVLDLKEVTLVDRGTIEFLARCQADGIELRNCPAYIREWLEREERRQ
jgi:anti-anti-sigma regulatory factor